MMVAENNNIVDWKVIQGEVEKQVNTKVVYTRYNKEEKSGHFVINKFAVDEAKIESV